MLEFRKITPADRTEILEYLKDNPSRICENTAGVILLWDVDERIRYAVEDGTMYLAEIKDGKAIFYYPIGGDEEKALEKIEEFCRERKLTLHFRFLSAEQAEKVKTKFGQEGKPDRNWADYLYSAAELKTLSGKKFHGQKNFVNRFSREYPDHKFLPYEVKMRPLAEEFAEKFYDEENKDSRIFKEEKRIFCRILSEYASTGQTGGVLTVGGKIVAITFGEVVGDTLYVHFEKALRKYKGSYAMINYLFVNSFKKPFDYVNREEDVGDEGLRQAKLNLHPVRLIEKFFT